MGNTMNIAYGGYALAAAVNAALRTISPGYHMYSMMGHYLGPSLTDRTLRCSVRHIRNTRTFATRQIEVIQRQDDGETRPVLMALADFQVQEPASLLTYSAPPKRIYSSAEDCPKGEVNRAEIVRSKSIDQKLADIHAKSFGVLPQHFEMRSPPESIMAQNLTGMAKSLPTTQDDLPLPSKSSADWFRPRVPLSTEAEHIIALAFMMDAAMAFTPLAHNHMFLDDSGACSSLDFALRIFKNGVDMNEWMLKELGTVVGAEGRTFTEGNLFDREGRLVARISQQSILRPLSRGKRKGKEKL